MIQIQLLALAQKQLPNLNLEEEKDLIKIEKLLKAEAKLDPKIRINDIENLLDFLKTNKGNFIPILKNKNVMNIVDGNGKTINFAPFDFTGISEETLIAFQEAFSPNILNYVKLSIRTGAWNRLKSIFIHYTFLLNDEIWEVIFQSFSEKNKATMAALQHNQYIDFCNVNPYATEPGYYELLSVMSPHYFDDEVLVINNLISDQQITNSRSKACLGKILYAATYFQAYSDNLRTTLESNQEAALQWMYPERIGEDSSMSTSSIILMIVIGVIVFIFLIAINTRYASLGIGVMVLIVRIFRLINKK